MSLSPTRARSVKKKKKMARARPEWTQRVGPRRVPTGLQTSKPWVATAGKNNRKQTNDSKHKLGISVTVCTWKRTIKIHYSHNVCVFVCATSSQPPSESLVIGHKQLWLAVRKAIWLSGQ